MVKPIIVVGFARVVSPVVLVAFGFGHVLGVLTPLAGGALSYGLTLVALLAMPRVRRSDVAAGVVTLLTVGAFAAAIDRGVTDAAVWMVALAGVGAALLPIELAAWRMRSARNPHRTSAERRRARARRPADADAVAQTVTPYREAIRATAPAILIAS